MHFYLTYHTRSYGSDPRNVSIGLCCRIKRYRKARYDRRPPMDKTFQTRCAAYSSSRRTFEDMFFETVVILLYPIVSTCLCIRSKLRSGERNSNALNSSIDYRSIVQLISVRELYFERNTRNTFERRSPQFLELSQSACAAVQSGQKMHVKTGFHLPSKYLKTRRAAYFFDLVIL